MVCSNIKIYKYDYRRDSMGEDKFFSAEGSAKKDPQTNSPEAEKTASSSAQKSPDT